MVLGAQIALAPALVPSLAGTGERPERIREQFAARLPGVAIETMTPTPVPGVFEIAHEDGVLYLSEDGRYAFTGKLVDLETREDLTERTRARERNPRPPGSYSTSATRGCADAGLCYPPMTRSVSLMLPPPG